MRRFACVSAPHQLGEVERLDGSQQIMPDPCKRLPFMSSLGRASKRWQPGVRYEHVVQTLQEDQNLKSCFPCPDAVKN